MNNSVQSETKVGVTKQIDSYYFRKILTQDGTVNSFQGVQRKQTFIWSIEIETFEAMEALKTQLISPALQLQQEVQLQWTPCI